MEDDRISLAHGNGGRFMRELIEEIFARHLGGSGLDVQADAAPISLGSDDVMMTTDGFTVQPLEFPGGDIGSLAVHGTTNDLAVAGARPMFFTLNAFIEEGLEIKVLDRIVASLAKAAADAGVKVVAGDTKVLRRGEGGGLYLATTGVGVRLPGVRPAINQIMDGDIVIVSGTVGDHGTAVMLAREDFGLRGEVVSDAGPVMALTEALLLSVRPGWVFALSPRFRSRNRCNRCATCSATILSISPAKAA
jgi:hydrogenase expression/formation protein HypE